MIECAENTLALKQYLSPYGIELEDKQLSLILRHLDLIVEKNKVMNLTRIIEPKEAIIRHDVDSLLLLPSIQDNIDISQARFLDIGTGGGVPGIPLGIMSGCHGLLVDSVKKKSLAVQDFIQKLDLEGSLMTSSLRAEELALKEPRSFDLVTARALSSLPSLVELAAPLLRDKGFLLALKGSPEDAEIMAGDNAASVCGMTLLKREDHILEPSESCRSLFLYQKIAKPRIKLPRRVGLAQRSPLA